MTCRSCGHTIADNAIVCYKCGTPTAIPEAAPRLASESAVPPTPGWVLPLTVLLVIAAVAAAVWGTGAARWVEAAAGFLLAALTVGWGSRRSRR